MLVTKSRHWFLKQGALLVPPELRESVDQLLGRIMPGVGYRPGRRNR